MSGHIRILLVDRHMLFLKGLQELLLKDKDFEVIGAVGDGQKAVEFMKANHKRVDVILMGLKMPIMDGFETTQIIKSRYSDTQVIILTMYEEPKFVLEALGVGASSFLSKNSTESELFEAIRSCVQNGYYFNHLVSGVLLQNIQKNKIISKYNDLNQEATKLTDREVEVLRLIASQYTTSEIAEKMELSPRTIESYRFNLLEKTSSRNTLFFCRLTCS